jgi:hypothetical protein
MDTLVTGRMGMVVTGQVGRQDREDRAKGGGGNDMAHC